MKGVIAFVIVIGLIAVPIFLGKRIETKVCPLGLDDWTRIGCGHSVEEINKRNCENNGGTYMYGYGFYFHTAGNCLLLKSSQ